MIINKAFRTKLAELRDAIKDDSSIMVRLNRAKDHLMDDTCRFAYISALEKHGLGDGLAGGGLNEVKASVGQS